MSQSNHAHGHLAQLRAKVDGFFAAVFDRHGDRMSCAPGCSDCCHSRFSVTLVEADVIAEGMAQLEPATRERLRERARAGDPGRCAALDADGLCEIFIWRPLICRSHGAPIRYAEPASDAPNRDRADADPVIHGADGRTYLHVVEVCPKNFVDGLDDVAPGMMLDQETVSTVLAAIDAAHSDAHGVARGTRVELAELLARP